MKFDVGALLDSLPIMGYGMLGIFIVTGIIILSVYLLNGLTKPKKSGSEEEK